MFGVYIWQVTFESDFLEGEESHAAFGCPAEHGSTWCVLLSQKAHHQIPSLTQVALIAVSYRAAPIWLMVVVVVLHPVLPSADAGPNLCTLHPDLCTLNPDLCIYIALVAFSFRLV